MENKTTRTNKNDLFKINWSEKVMQLDETISKVQTKSPESIEPAFIVGEDELFLELFVLSPENGGIISTAVLKNNIQSIGVIGGVSSEKRDISEISSEELLNDFGGLYQ